MRAKLCRWVRNMSIFHKIALITIVVTGLISVISNSFLLLRFSEDVNDKNRLLIQEAAGRVEDLVRSKYNMLYNQQTLIHSTGYIASIITDTRNSPGSNYRQENLSKITDYLTALGFSDADILDTVIFTEDGTNAFSYSPVQGRVLLLSYPYSSIPYVRSFGDSDDNITVFYDPDPPYLSLSSENDSTEVVTFLAKIYDTRHPAQRILNGYLLINIAPQTLEDTYAELDPASDGNYLVINRDSSIICSNNSDYVGQQYSETFLPASDILSESSISLSGIRIIGSVSEHTLRGKIRNMSLQVTLVTALGLLLLVTAVMLLHRFYSRKFQQLIAAMQQIGSGDFSVSLPYTSDDEVGDLVRAFNTMRETLDQYIKKTYLAETQRRTAELYALQAQINPHFLNNTIESIRMKALDDGEYEVSEMLASFGSLFRWMIRLDENIICVEDEMDYIDAYLNLQKLRFRDKVSVRTDVPAGVLFLGIPRFTLQPVVENTISHAAKPSGEPLLISIRFRISGDILELTVEDDGRGMAADTLERLRAHVCGAADYPEFGIALRNVHTRIQLLFGEAYGMEIESRSGAGTTVRIRIPVIEKEENDRYVQDHHCG